MRSEKLITQLIEQTKQIIAQAKILKGCELDVLTFRENQKSWNILECLQHLNLYGDFYLPEIESKIAKSITTTEIEFKSGLLGNYFAKSMLPKEKLNKMKTFKNKNPLNNKIDRTVIDTFINQQIKLLELLNQSRTVSLSQTKINISISSFIRLQLGDAFQFYLNHIMRHLQQIEKIKSSF
ncbi:DinB family protein [Flavobacterium sp. TAB 87]|uniref:DinB family protein n=1 Tax=Flavobacterium sp. TAB 87 TaxID=1729581 RepID=UPI00076CF9FF|nr:DinB family protein [Flavobacterium sp. TAB 87]KVV14567.1 DinB superfamily protein [Flavobacterium sp. TAB 87]